MDEIWAALDSLDNAAGEFGAIEEDLEQLKSKLIDLTSEGAASAADSTMAVKQCDLRITEHEKSINRKLSHLNKVANQQETLKNINFGAPDLPVLQSIDELIAQYLSEQGYASVAELMPGSAPPSADHQLLEAFVQGLLHKASNGEAGDDHEMLLQQRGRTKPFRGMQKHAAQEKIWFAFLKALKEGTAAAFTYLESVWPQLTGQRTTELMGRLLQPEQGDLDEEIQNYIEGIRESLVEMGQERVLKREELQKPALNWIVQVGQHAMQKYTKALLTTNLLDGTTKELPVEIELPESGYRHPIFVCPVRKEPSKRIAVLPCGHMLSKDAVESLFTEYMRISCPYCSFAYALEEVKDGYLLDAYQVKN